MMHRVFLTAFCLLISTTAQAQQEDSPPAASTLTDTVFGSGIVTIGDVLGTIELVFSLGSIALVAIAGVVAITGYRSIRDLREELRRELDAQKSFIESRNGDSWNLRGVVSDEIRANFQELFDLSVKNRSGTNHPELLEIVKSSSEKVSEYLEKVNTLPQFDRNAVSTVPDYSAIQLEAEKIRTQRVSDIFDQVQKNNPEAPAEEIDRFLSESYSNHNRKNISNRNKVRELFERAINAAIAALNSKLENQGDRALSALDANEFYNLSAEAGNWSMKDAQLVFAQIAFSIKPTDLYELRAIDTKQLNQVGISDPDRRVIGIGPSAREISVSQRLVEIISKKDSDERFLELAVGWNIVNKSGKYDLLLDILEKNLSTETDDPNSWVDISYANYSCARLHAHLSRIGWREKFELHVNQTVRKLEYESRYSDWHSKTSDALGDLITKVDGRGPDAFATENVNRAD